MCIVVVMQFSLDELINRLKKKIFIFFLIILFGLRFGVEGGVGAGVGVGVGG